jgi:hypothetical protein
VEEDIRWYIAIGSAYLSLLRSCFIDVNPAQPVTDVHSVFTWERMIPHLPAASAETRRAVAYQTKDGREFLQLDIDEVIDFCLTLLEHLSVQVATDVELNSLATNALQIIHDLIQLSEPPNQICINYFCVVFYFILCVVKPQFYIYITIERLIELS